MKEIDKIIYRGNDTYTKLYAGDTLEYQRKIDYLSFTAFEDSTISTNITGTISPAPNVEYSRDKSTWSDLTTTTVSLSAGDTIYVRGNNPNSFSLSNKNYLSFVMTGNISAGGSIATLINKKDDSLVPADRYFTGLFRGCSALKNVDNLKLAKADNMTGCYSYCFMLSGLTTVPDNFIENCGLSVSMYGSCFRECLSLTKAPRLPKGSVLPKECFSNMFNRCSALTDISNIDLSFSEIQDKGCFQMFYNCTSLPTSPELPATIIGVNCYKGMFALCSKLAKAPSILPATTLVFNCYREMFRGCTNLNYIKCLATDISAIDCTTYWLEGVSATGTFVKPTNMSGWTTGASGIPAGWTVENE